MKYLLMIYGNEAEQTKMSEAQQAAQMTAYNDFTNEVNQRGVFSAGEALMPTAMATTVRMHNGKTVTTDGPFAETKEQLGGFYLLDCKDLDEAIGFAAKIPGAAYGSIEVRPVVVFN